MNDEIKVSEEVEATPAPEQLTEVELLEQRRAYWQHRIVMKRDELKELNEVVSQFLTPDLLVALQIKTHDLSYAASQEGLLVGQIEMLAKLSKAA